MTAQSRKAAAEVAGGQRGLVTRADLLGCGLSPWQIDRWLQGGWLHARHPGVYLLGHSALAHEAEEQAALLACGSHAHLSYLTSGHLWKMGIERPHSVHVTVVGRDCGRKEGVVVHRARRLDPRDVREIRGLSVLSPARTILDLAEAITADRLERVVAEAEFRRLVTPRELAALMDRSRGRRGIKRLREVLALEGGPAFTRNDAEHLLLDRIRADLLPVPRVNARLFVGEVDFLWAEERLVVELDGFQGHGTRSAFERDRLRDAELQARGYRVIRVTWRQLSGDPDAVVARIASALALEAARRQ